MVGPRSVPVATVGRVPHVHWTVIRLAVAVGLSVVIPAALVAQVLADEHEESSGWVLLFFVVTVLGFVLAGFVAGRLRSDTPLSHGATAGAVTWAAVQVFGTVRRVVADESVSWLGIVFAGMLAVTAGVAGGAFGDWFRRRIEPRIARRPTRSARSTP